MKKRLLRYLIVFSIILSFAITFTISVVDYTKYKKSEMLSVKRSCEIISSILNNGEDSDIYNLTTTDTRVTVVSPSGVVLFDTDAVVDSLGNHKDRTEIASAIKTGTGESFRQSDSIHKIFYYYAIRLDSGNILRVSHSFMGVWQSVLRLLPFVILFVIIFGIVSVIVVSIMTKQIIEPIDNTTKRLDELLTDKDVVLNELTVYDEFIPFIRKLDKLNMDIKAYASELAEQTQRLNAIGENMKEGLIVVGADKSILSMNNGAAKVLKIQDKKSLTGKNFINACRDSSVNEAIAKALETKKSVYIDVEGRQKFYKYFFSPVITDGTECKGLIVIIINMTSEMMAEQQRRDFATNVSHELKTPLTSIAGFAEMLKGRMISDPDEVVKTSSIIYRESSRLITLVEEIIRLSEIESGKNNEREELDLNDTVMDAVNAVENSAKEKQLDITVESHSVLISANASSLYELVFNLCDNAVKYNKQGGSVTVKSIKNGDNAEITVNDTGIGIPREHIDRIFERFYRVDKSRSKQTGGTGLGLSIVKHIVEDLKGKINIDSKEGKGTEIKVSLPL